MSTEGWSIADELPTRVLVVAAHPDDVDFGAAGAVATWTAAGAEVAYCIVTDGEAGGTDPSVTRAGMAEMRRAEQRSAAKIVGVDSVEFLGYPDGRVYPTLELRRDISAAIRRVRPNRVLCPSPEREFRFIGASHPDHLAVGEATICAVYPDARNPFAHPELLEAGLEPWSVTELWMMASPRADRYVDITAVIERKSLALAAHQSQQADPSNTTEMIRTFSSALAQGAGLGPDRYAEPFFVVTLPG
jgi:LmbE family N-acetylglucosaminyl deacetylase